MKEYRVIIAGSRNFMDYATLESWCDSILQPKFEDSKTQVVIISGGARGADTLGERYAIERHLTLERYPADWQQYGRSAGIIRNHQMAKRANAVIAFPKVGDLNRGTRNMVSVAEKEQLAVNVIWE
jgi:hypothetical protein